MQTQNQQPYIIEKSRGGRKRRHVYRVNRVGIALFILIICAAAAGLAVLFSLCFPAGVFIVKSKSYYVLQAKECASESESVAACLAARRMGGGGYVINDGVFRVTMAVYLTESDLLSVMSRLDEEEFVFKKYVVRLPELRLKRMENDAQTDKAFSLITYPDTVIRKLYELNLSLDKREISESAAILTLHGISAAVTEKSADAESDGELYLRVKTFYAKLSDVLAVASSQSGLTLSVRLKYAATEAAYEYLSFASALKAKFQA